MQLTSWQVSPATADFTKFVDIYLRIHEKSNHFGPFCSLKEQLIVPINVFPFRVNFNPSIAVPALRIGSFYSFEEQLFP